MFGKKSEPKKYKCLKHGIISSSEIIGFNVHEANKYSDPLCGLCLIGWFNKNFSVEEIEL